MSVIFVRMCLLDMTCYLGKRLRIVQMNGNILTISHDFIFKSEIATHQFIYSFNQFLSNEKATIFVVQIIFNFIILLQCSTINNDTKHLFIYPFNQFLKNEKATIFFIHIIFIFVTLLKHSAINNAATHQFVH